MLPLTTAPCSKREIAAEPDPLTLLAKTLADNAETFPCGKWHAVDDGVDRMSEKQQKTFGASREVTIRKTRGRKDAIIDRPALAAP
jgi:hypothetical protein